MNKETDEIEINIDSEDEHENSNPFDHCPPKKERESKFEQVRKKCDGFIESSTIEKSDALTILKLQHEMEKLVIETLFQKERNIETLKHEMDILRLSNKNAELLEKLNFDLSKCQKSIQELEQKNSLLEQRLETVAMNQTQVKRR